MAPAQASISLSQGSAPLVMSDKGFAMLPGSQQYAFVVAFNLPYNNQKVSLTQPFILSPTSATIIVPVGVKVTGAGLADQGASNFQGSSYQIYSAGALKAGTALELTLSGSPQTSAAGSPSTGTASALLIGLGILGLLLVLAGAFLLLRGRRKVRATEPDGTIEAGSMDEETARLADAILALDDRFAAGKINRETYELQRAELKEKLKGRL